MISVYIRIIYIVFVIIISGCATFHSEKYEKADYAELPDDCNIKPTLSYKILTDIDEEYSTNLEKVFIDSGAFESVIENNRIDSGVFESVIENNREADIHVNISIWPKYNRSVDKEKYFQENIKLVITMISIAIIPTFSNTGMDTNVEIIKDGESIKFEYHDEFTFVRWLQLLFIAPFNTSQQKFMEASTSIYAKIVNKIVDEVGWACSTSH